MLDFRQQYICVKSDHVITFQVHKITYFPYFDYFLVLVSGHIPARVSICLVAMKEPNIPLLSGYFRHKLSVGDADRKIFSWC